MSTSAASTIGAEDPFRAPIGTHDVLPPESARWTALLGAFASRAARFGYGLVLTPTLEHAEVFSRVGEGTDVVRKEMYQLSDRSGRRLVLRPEGTAAVVRAFVQHRPPVPWKVWYAAAHFRYERPQRGRYRQHHQLGAEVLGVDDPEADVEVISLAGGFFAALGLRSARLALNSLGDQRCRPGYLEALRSYLRGERDRLCPDSQARLEENPLRVLDCKRPECVAATRDAPRVLEHLCSECATHLERVERGLRAIGQPYELAPRLVRGLDYYNRTTFEFSSDALDAAQNALGGGGRYDLLAEEMGGPPTPGIGFGIGIERLLLACDAEDAFPVPPATMEVFVVDALAARAAAGDASPGTEVVALLHGLREAGLTADRAYGGRPVKAQLRAADRSGARLAVVVGRSELERGMVAIKDLETGQQREMEIGRVAGFALRHCGRG